MIVLFCQKHMKLQIAVVTSYWTISVFLGHHRRLQRKLNKLKNEIVRGTNFRYCLILKTFRGTNFREFVQNSQGYLSYGLFISCKPWKYEVIKFD